jgi:chromosome segregation ATPase
MRLKMAQLGWPSDGEPVAMLMTSHGEIERELANLREQIPILRSDEKRLMQFAKTYRLRADELERELEQERQDRKQADLEALRALGERNDARAMVDSLRSLVTTDHESKESFIYRVAVTLNMPTRAQIDAHLEERNDARAIIDATLKALPVGYIPAHTPESLPGRVADLVSELAVWHHEAKRLEAELASFDETAIEWWCEYQDLKAKALEP